MGLNNYPVSVSENIKINLLKTSNAENNKETGLLTWIKKIEPNKFEDLKIIYKIEAPEGFKLKP